MPTPVAGGALNPYADLVLTGNVQLAGAGSGIQQYPVSGSGAVATVALQPSQSGGLFLFDRAAGVTYTLPLGVPGMNFEFAVTVSVTSNNHKIITNSANTGLFIGSLWETVAAGTGTSFFPNGSSHIACTMNGTTTGGLINTYITVFCINSTTWLIDGTNMASGTIATPFATS